MYRLLLVEDDEEIREVITDYFSRASDTMTVETAPDGQKGLEMLYENEYDLIMLDVMLPYIDGFSICREIRKKSSVPVLFLTARGREEDILYGYENGCDDYIVKPFRIAELMAKANALIRRSKGMVRSEKLVCGRIELDPLCYTVYVSGAQAELAPKEYALLKYLMEHRGMAVSRESLLKYVWGYDFDGNDRVVDNHIKKLRKQLGTAGLQIKTVFGRGYKLEE